MDAGPSSIPLSVESAPREGHDLGSCVRGPNCARTSVVSRQGCGISIPQMCAVLGRDHREDLVGTNPPNPDYWLGTRGSGGLYSGWKVLCVKGALSDAVDDSVPYERVEEDCQ